MGRLRRPWQRPLRKGERPTVIDKIPNEKTLTVSPLTNMVIEAVHNEIHQPPPPTSSFLHHHHHRAEVKTLNNFEDELAALKSPGTIPRIEQVNKCLKSMIDAGKAEQALNLIPKMEMEFGVTPNEATESLVAEIALKKAKPQEALKLLDGRVKLTDPREDVLFGKLVISMLKKDLKQGLQVYERYIEKSIRPSPLVVATAITACAQQDHVERGFRIYREAREGKCMSPNTITQCALLQAAAHRKEYYQEAICAFRQMIAMNMPLQRATFSNLMMATGKVGDMQTALLIYQHCKELNFVTPNLATYFFFALAATESALYKLSLRPYATRLDSKEIVAVAKEAFDEVQSEANEKVLTAYLACLYVHREPVEAERIFYSELAKYGPRQAKSVENMLRLYDTLHDVQGLERVLKEVVQVEKTIITRKSYRAIVRTYAYNANYDVAIEWMQKMRDAGFIPTLKELDILYMRLCQSDSFELKKRFIEIAAPNPRGHSNQFLPWRLRSLRIAEVMKNAYGPNAPKSATSNINTKLAH